MFSILPSETSGTTNDFLQDVDSVIRQNSPPQYDMTTASCSPPSMYHHQPRDTPEGVIRDDETASKSKILIENLCQFYIIEYSIRTRIRISWEGRIKIVTEMFHLVQQGLESGILLASSVYG